MDVLPDIQLGPVAQRKCAYALALVHFTVEQVPEFRSLIFGIPLMKTVAKAVNAFLGPTLLLITTGTTKRSVKLVVVESLLQSSRLHDVGGLF